VVFAQVGLRWAPFVRIDPAYFRPTEVEHLRADAAKAGAKLGWAPETTSSELATLMVKADLEALGLDLGAAREKAARRHPEAVVG